MINLIIDTIADFGFSKGFVFHYFCSVTFGSFSLYSEITTGCIERLRSTCTDNASLVGLTVMGNEAVEKEDFFCCICFRPYLRPITLRCAHSFCRHCILKALKANPCCPLCRSPHNYEDLFGYSENKLLKKLTSAFTKDLSSKDRVFLEKRHELAGREDLLWDAERKKIDNSRKWEKGGTCFGFWRKVQPCFTVVCLLALLITILELVCQSFLILKIPGLVDSETLKEIGEDVWGGKAKRVGSKSGDNLQTEPFGFLQSAAGAYARETFVPTYSTIALLKYMEDYLFNNTFTGLALEALVRDPLPNFTKLLRMYINNDL